MNNNELYHYGTPGMKWGVRKVRQKSNTSSKSNTKTKRKHNTLLDPDGAAVIGRAAVAVALIGIGAKLTSMVRNNNQGSNLVGKLLEDTSNIIDI